MTCPNWFMVLAILTQLALWQPQLVVAQVTSIISYQGRVSAAGSPFTGTGYFKFAFVSPGSASSGVRATASGTVSYGFVVSLTVLNGGSGYATAPAVTITDPTGTGASATATISGGVVVGITVQNTGHGYSTTPSITIAAPSSSLSYVSFWSNDGTSAGASEPSSAVAFAVSEGLFHVLLGDTAIANMVAIPPSLFTNSDVRLRIWFNDGVHGSTQLSPDQRITATGYALMAANIPDGLVTSAKLAPNAVQAGAVATGAIGTTQLAALAVTGSRIAANTIDITKLSFTPLTIETDPKVAVTTSNTIARWNGTTLVNGTMFDNGNIGIGKTNPVAKLDINGTLAINGTNVINALGQWVGSTAGFQGPQGVQGVAGAPGPQGPIGATGPQGAAGGNGNTVWNGNGSPSNSLGTNGDFYIDIAAKAIHGPKTNGAWGGAISLIGPGGPLEQRELPGRRGFRVPGG